MTHLKIDLDKYIHWQSVKKVIKKLRDHEYVIAIERVSNFHIVLPKNSFRNT